MFDLESALAQMNEAMAAVRAVQAELRGTMLAKSADPDAGLDLMRKAIQTGLASGRMLPSEVGVAEHHLNRVTPKPDAAAMRKCVQSAFEENKISLMEKNHLEGLIQSGLGHFVLDMANW